MSAYMAEWPPLKHTWLVLDTSIKCVNKHKSFYCVTISKK